MDSNLTIAWRRAVTTDLQPLPCNMRKQEMFSVSHLDLGLYVMQQDLVKATKYRLIESVPVSRLNLPPN